MLFASQGRPEDEATIPAGPYTLADFGTSTMGMGDQSIAFRLYHRELARLGSTRPVGAAQLYDGAPRVPLPPSHHGNKVNLATFKVAAPTFLLHLCTRTTVIHTHTMHLVDVCYFQVVRWWLN